MLFATPRQRPKNHSGDLHNMKKFKVEFMDFTEIGGHGSYLMRVKADSKQEAEKKVLAAYSSAWDIKAVLVAQYN